MDVQRRNLSLKLMVGKALVHAATDRDPSLLSHRYYSWPERNVARSTFEYIATSLNYRHSFVIKLEISSPFESIHEVRHVFCFLLPLALDRSMGQCGHSFARQLFELILPPR